MQAAIYTRFSSELQRDSYSIEAQLTECRELAEKRGWEIVRVYIDEAESAKTTKRPAFQELMRDVKFKKFDVIIVHKLDRFSRSLIDVLLIARDLNEYNVRFVSATEEFDFTTPQGWIMMVLLAMLAEWFLKNLRTEVRKGKKARAASGLYNGPIPVGYEVDYLQDGGDGIPVVYEPEAEAVALAYDHYSEGHYSDMDITNLLNEKGYRRRPTPRRKHTLWTRDAVRDVLMNRFYIGEVPYKDQWFEGVHEPIVSDELFEKCQAVRRKRSKKYGITSRGDSRTYLLTGITKCARCGGRMSGWYQTKNKTRYYMCRVRREKKTCNLPQIKASKAEESVALYLMDLELPKDLLSRAEEIFDTLFNGDKKEDIRRERKRLTEALKRIQDMYELGDLSRSEYLKKRDYYKAQIDALLPPITPDFEEVAEILTDFKGIWEAATNEERKKIFHTVLKEVRLDKGKEPVVIVKDEIKPLLDLS